MATQTVESLVNGGKASAAPPLGPALGPLGVNIGEVVAEINKKTQAFAGMQVPVKVEVDTESKEFSISVGTPPASSLVKQEAHIQKGSGKPQEEFVADLKMEQIIKIALMKESNLLGKDNKSMVKEILGTCNAMGVKVEGKKAVETIRDVNAGMYDEKIASGKTELSAEELAKLEEERKAMQAELEKKHALEESLAKGILAEMEGKPRKEIAAKMKEAGVSDTVMNKVLPAEEGEAAAPAPASE